MAERRGDTAPDGFLTPKAAERRTREREAAQVGAERQAYDEGRRAAASSRRTRTPAQQVATSQVRPGSPQRTIVGTMAFATVFALLSTLIEQGTGQTTPGTAAHPSVRIMIGGGTGTILLLMISHAGEPGEQLAEGLALVTMVTVVLVKGAPLWKWANNLFGTTPTTSTAYPVAGGAATYGGGPTPGPVVPHTGAATYGGGPTPGPVQPAKAG